MAGNARFHNKFHRRGHHTDPSTGYPDSGTDPIASQAEPFLGDFYLDGSLSANKNLFIGGDATILGNLSVLGDLSYLDTIVSVTSALSVVNVGTGPALTVVQHGAQPIAKFIDKEGTCTLLLDDGGLVGFNTCILEPGIGITINNTISSNQALTANANIGAYHFLIGSVAEGRNTRPTGTMSHAEGDNTIASNDSTHAEGYYTSATGQYGAHAEGALTRASGFASHAEGYSTSATGDYSHAQGYYATASGPGSHAEGEETVASGEASHAQGSRSVASGFASHAGGEDTIAANNYAHAEGKTAVASGQASHAGGTGTRASNTNSFAHGLNVGASGVNSFALGENSVARNYGDVALGFNANAVHAQSLVYSNYSNYYSSCSFADNTFNVFASGGSFLLDPVTVGDPVSAIKFIVAGNGNVGVNTAYPNEQFTVFGNTSGLGVFTYTSPNYGALLARNSTYNGRLSALAVDPLTHLVQGRLGINTTPVSSYALHVRGGNIRVDGVDYSAAAGTVGFDGTVYDTDGQSLFDLRSGFPDANYSLSIAQSGLGNFIKLFGGRLNDDKPFINIKKNTPMRFGTFDTFYGTNYEEHMRIGRTGNIGIHTNHPWVAGAYDNSANEALTVNGNISANGTLSATGAGVNYFANNVGIGTNTPEQKLHVLKASAGIVTADTGSIAVFEGSGNNHISILTPDAQTSGVVFGSPADSYGSYVSWNHDNNALKLATAKTTGFIQLLTNSELEAVRITSSGNVGIGTTIPAEKLTVSGNISANGTLSASGAGNNYINGNLGIGTATPGEKLTVSGNILGTGTLSAGGVGNNYINGSLGIGTATPNEKLSINGNLSANGNLTIDGNSTLGNASGDITNINSGTINLNNATTSTGLVFGTTNSANLYRSAADTLKTDDNFIVGVLGAGTTDTVVIHNASNQLQSRTINSKVWDTAATFLSGQTLTTNYLTKALNNNNNTLVNSTLIDTGTDITTTSNLGIKTTSPLHALTVIGSISSSQGLSAANVTLTNPVTVIPTSVTDSGEFLILNLNNTLRAIRLWNYTV